MTQPSTVSTAVPTAVSAASASRHAVSTEIPPALRAVIAASRSAIASAGFFSLFLNLLMLVPSIYMLQVYDRVLSTGSVPTLLMLTLITTFMFIVFGGLEWLRAQVMIVASMRFDAVLGPVVHEIGRAHV